MARIPIMEKTWTLEQFVTEKIHDIFLEIAGVVSNTPMPVGEAAGTTMKLFRAETLLINTWGQFMRQWQD